MDIKKIRLIDEESSDSNNDGKITDTKIAELLKVSSKTIANWESKNLEIKDLELLRAIWKEYTPKLLLKIINQMVEKAFKLVPSEIICVMIFNPPSDIIVLPNSMYLHYDNGNNNYSDKKSLENISLTTHPLRSGEILNLAADQILEHPAKAYKVNRSSSLAKGCIAESILRIPAFIPTYHGPGPLFMISMENKLDKSAKNVIKLEPSSKEQIYTNEDIKKIESLINEYKPLLREKMLLLELVSEK